MKPVGMRFVILNTVSHNLDISSLVRLIDDPDKSVYEHVRDQLIAAGPEVIPVLETSWRTEHYNGSIQERVDEIISQIQSESSYTAMERWLFSIDRDLLEGALIVAGYADPFLNPKDVRDYIDHLVRKVDLSLSYRMTAMEQVMTLNKVFFQSEGYKGDEQDFHSSTNSVLTDVIALRKGNPLSLSVLYSIVSQRLEIPIYGVNLPGHFVVAYTAQNHFFQVHQSCKHTGEVLFYISPYHSGRFFDEEEMMVFLKKMKIEPQPSHYLPCSNSTIINRMLSNLAYAYKKSGKLQKSEEIKKIQLLLQMT